MRRSLLLAAVAAAAFALGIILNLAGGRFVMGIAAITLWRFSIGCIGFAIYLELYARDRK